MAIMGIIPTLYRLRLSGGKGDNSNVVIVENAGRGDNEDICCALVAMVTTLW